MKIGSFESKPLAPASTTPAAGKPTVSVKQAGVQASTEVALSSAASALSSTGSGSDATFDTAKVERISQAIRDGKFQVNPGAIADKLITNAEELLGRKLSS